MKILVRGCQRKELPLLDTLLTNFIGCATPELPKLKRKKPLIKNYFQIDRNRIESIIFSIKK